MFVPSFKVYVTSSQRQIPIPWLIYIINYNLITTDSISQGYLFLLYYSSTLLVITENSWDEPDNCKQSKKPDSHWRNKKAHSSLSHTRTMIWESIQNFGCVTNAVKPATLRYFYKDLTDDYSSSNTTDQAQIGEEWSKRRSTCRYSGNIYIFLQLILQIK